MSGYKIGGFYLMPRGWMDTPALTAGREPFCRRAAWAWLVEEASWTDRQVDVGGTTVSLRRGQIVHSIRFMAQAWNWTAPAVDRFLKRLRTDTLTETAIISGRLVITICNYERYQDQWRMPAGPTDTPTETPARQQRDSAETPARHQRDKKETRETRERKKRRESRLGLVRKSG